MNIRDNFNTESFRFVNYVNLTESQSRAIWEGRNHPDVRQWMDNPEPFAWEAHLSYVENLKQKDDRSYWAVIRDNNIIGSMCLNPIGKNMPPSYYSKEIGMINGKWAETGMFLLPMYIGKGFGTKMKKEFIDYILLNTDIETLLLKTQHNNKRVIKLNETLGYKIINKDDIYVYMSKTR